MGGGSATKEADVEGVLAQISERVLLAQLLMDNVDAYVYGLRPGGLRCRFSLVFDPTLGVYIPALLPRDKRLVYSLFIVSKALDALRSAVGSTAGKSILYIPVMTPKLTMLHPETMAFNLMLLKNVYSDILGEAEELHVVIWGFGGETSEAFVLALMLRSIADSEGKRLVALIPRTAMSASGMLALVADEVLVSRIGYLGPLDPQVRVREGRYVSALAARRLLDLLRSIGFNTAAHIKELLDIPGALEISDVEASIISAEELVYNVLSRGAMKNRDRDSIRKAAERLVRHWRSHGHPLTLDDLKSYGLSIGFPDERYEAMLLSFYGLYRDYIIRLLGEAEPAYEEAVPLGFGVSTIPLREATVLPCMMTYYMLVDALRQIMLGALVHGDRVKTVVSDMLGSDRVSGDLVLGFFVEHARRVADTVGGGGRLLAVEGPLFEDLVRWRTGKKLEFEKVYVELVGNEPFSGELASPGPTGPA